MGSSGLSLSARVELMSSFNSFSLVSDKPNKGLLSILPPEVAEDIEKSVYKSNFQKVLNEGMGINPASTGGHYISMNKFKYRKYKHFIDCDKTISYIDNTTGSAWKIFNYDGYIRGMTLLKYYNTTKDKNEKMYYLMLLGMCNIGLCNSKNPFGEKQDVYPDSEIATQKNYDLQYRMYQICGMKYYEIPEDITEQLKSVKPKSYEDCMGYGVGGNKYNHFTDGTKTFDNKVILKGCYQMISHYTKKIKCKHVRLCKGKYIQCDEIAEWFKYLCRYEVNINNQLYYSEFNYYHRGDKKLLLQFFKSSFPYDPSYFDPLEDKPFDYF